MCWSISDEIYLNLLAGQYLEQWYNWVAFYKNYWRAWLFVCNA